MRHLFCFLKLDPLMYSAVHRGLLTPLSITLSSVKGVVDIVALKKHFETISNTKLAKCFTAVTASLEKVYFFYHQSAF